MVSVDGIDLRDLDFIDLAPPAGRSNAVPVTVKSLVFPVPRPLLAEPSESGALTP